MALVTAIYNHFTPPLASSSMTSIVVPSVLGVNALSSTTIPWKAESVLNSASEGHKLTRMAILAVTAITLALQSSNAPLQYAADVGSTSNNPTSTTESYQPPSGPRRPRIPQRSHNQVQQPHRNNNHLFIEPAAPPPTPSPPTLTTPGIVRGFPWIIFIILAIFCALCIGGSLYYAFRRRQQRAQSKVTTTSPNPEVADKTNVSTNDSITAMAEVTTLDEMNDKCKVPTMADLASFCGIDDYVEPFAWTTKNSKSIIIDGAKTITLSVSQPILHTSIDLPTIFQRPVQIHPVTHCNIVSQAHNINCFTMGIKEELVVESMDWYTFDYIYRCSKSLTLLKTTVLPIGSKFAIKCAIQFWPLIPYIATYPHLALSFTEGPKDEYKEVGYHFFRINGIHICYWGRRKLEPSNSERIGALKVTRSRMVQQIERFLWLSQDSTLNAYDDFDNLKNFFCSSRTVGKAFLMVLTYIGLAVFCVISSACIATLFATSLFREPRQVMRYFSKVFRTILNQASWRMMFTLGEIIMFLFWMVVGFFRVLRMIGWKIKDFFSKKKKATSKSQPRDSGYVFNAKSWTEQFTVVQTLRPTATMEYEFYISVNPSEQELKLAQQMRPEDYAHLDQYQREQITLHKSYQPMRIFNPANPSERCCSIGRLSEEDLQEKRCEYCYRGKPPTRDPDTEMTPHILTQSQFYALNRVKLHTYPPYEALRVMTDLYHDLCLFSINGIQTLGSVAAMEDPERFLLPCPELPAIFSDYRYHKLYPEMAELYWRFTSYYMFHPPPDPSTLYEPRKPFQKEVKLAPQPMIPENPPKEILEPPTPDPVTLKPSVNTAPSHSDPMLAPKPYVPTLYPDPVEICCFRGRITEVELEYEQCQFCLKGNPNPELRPPEPEEIPEHFYPKCRYLDISYCHPENHILYPEMAAKYRSYMNHERKYPPRKPVVTTIRPTTEPEDKEKTPTQRTQPLPPVVSDNMPQYDESPITPPAELKNQAGFVDQPIRHLKRTREGEEDSNVSDGGGEEWIDIKKIAAQLSVVRPDPEDDMDKVDYGDDDDDTPDPSPKPTISPNHEFTFRLEPGSGLSASKSVTGPGNTYHKLSTSSTEDQEEEEEASVDRSKKFKSASPSKSKTSTPSKSKGTSSRRTRQRPRGGII